MQMWRNRVPKDQSGRSAGTQPIRLSAVGRLAGMSSPACC